MILSIFDCFQKQSERLLQMRMNFHCCAVRGFRTSDALQAVSAFYANSLLRMAAKLDDDGKKRIAILDTSSIILPRQMMIPEEVCCKNHYSCRTVQRGGDPSTSLFCETPAGRELLNGVVFASITAFAAGSERRNDFDITNVVAKLDENDNDVYVSPYRNSRRHV